MGVELTHDEKREIFKFIDRELPIITGAAPFGNDEEPVRYIAGFVIRKFPSFRANTLRDAFEEAAAMKLFVGNTPIDIRMYGKPISTEVVGRVLYAYIDHIKNATNASKLSASRPVAEPVKKPTGREMYEGMLEIIAIEGDMPRAYPFELIHDYMVEQGMLKPLPPQRFVPAVARRRGLEHLSIEFSGHDRHKDAIRDYMVKTKAIEPKPKSDVND